MMTKKHFKILADIVNNNTVLEEGQEELKLLKYAFVRDLCDWLEIENPRFNRHKFIDACYSGSPTFSPEL